MRRIWGNRLGQGAGVLAAVLFSTTLLAPSLRADDGGEAAARAVRLSSVDGSVQLQQGNQMLADHAIANTPLFEGTQVTTGNDGRAEIQFEDGSVARLSPDGAFTLSVLRSQAAGGGTEIALSSGLGYFEMQGDGQGGGLRVRFGDSVVTASGFTVLRVNLDKMPGEVAVFSGNAHVESAGALALDLHGGESVALNGADPSQYNLSESIEPDSWDSWNADRDQALTTAAASRTDATKGFADSNNPAWSDLDANGSWYDVPSQGRIWSPYEASNPGFDPYGSGYWMYTPRFGYMWVSGYSWGYMPYQCGSWNYFNSFGWGWAPGGCNPWWGGVGFGYGGYGGGGWVSNIGIAPPRYRMPDRTRPRNPRPMGGGGMRSVASLPVVAVNRKIEAGNTMLPARDKSHAVMIAGTVAEPLRPLPNRPHYDHGQVFSGGRPVGGAPAAGAGNRPGIDRPNFNQPRIDKPGYVQAPNPGNGNARPGGWPATGDNYRQNGPPAAPRQVGPPPSQNPPAGSYSRPSAPSRGTSAPSAPPSHPSGGGGAPSGGGGSRPSGGGGAPAGGGGGGASHPSAGPRR